MSADNGIYILETIGPEFRVIHTGGIDSLYFNWFTGEPTENPDVLIVNARAWWFGAQVFISEEEACNLANEMYNKVEFTEYGISKIKIDRLFESYWPGVEVSNPVENFKTFKEALEFIEREDTTADSISFYLPSGERIQLTLNENREIVLDKMEMGLVPLS